MNSLPMSNPFRTKFGPVGSPKGAFRKHHCRVRDCRRSSLHPYRHRTSPNRDLPDRIRSRSSPLTAEVPSSCSSQSFVRVHRSSAGDVYNCCSPSIHNANPGLGKPRFPLKVVSAREEVCCILRGTTRRLVEVRIKTIVVHIKRLNYIYLGVFITRS